MIPGTIADIGATVISVAGASFKVHDIGAAINNAGNAVLTSVTVTSGSLIIVAVSETSTTASIGSVSDSAGNTYIGIGSVLPNNDATGANGVAAGFYCPGCLAITNGSITYTDLEAGKPSAISAFYTTVATTNPLDTAVTVSAAGNSSNPSVTSGTPGSTNELFVAWVASPTGINVTFTQDSNYAAPFDNFRVQIAGGNLFNTSLTAKTYAPSYNGANTWAAQIFGFKHA